MAEVNGKSTGFSSGLSKRKPIKMDMTALVDVAFLLLTFFVLTATIQEQNFIRMTLPAADGTTEIVEDKVLTIVFCENDSFISYRGITNVTLQKEAATPEAFGRVIQTHLNLFAPRCGTEVSSSCWNPVFLLKPRKESRYQNLIDCLDELSIYGAKKYALGEFEPEDSLFIAKFTANSLQTM